MTTMPVLTTLGPASLLVMKTGSPAEGALAKAASAFFHGGKCFNNCIACRQNVPFPGRDGAYWYWPPSREHAALSLLSYADEAAKKKLAPKAAIYAASSATSNEEISIPVPEGRKLYDYQRAGVAYLVGDREGVLVGDEPGLGKSPMSIAAINVLGSKTVLVCCPAMLRTNWRREAVKWLTDPHHIHVVEDKIRDEDHGIHRVTTGKEVPPEATFVIVNYDRARTTSVFFSLLRPEKWDVLVADEAHFLKNPKAARSQVVLGGWDKRDKLAAGLRDYAKRFWALTGTPLPNKPKEMWPILRGVAPKTFSNFFSFGKRFCDGHQEKISRFKSVWLFDGASNLGELQSLLRTTCMVRRLKEVVLPDLPKKRRSLVTLDLPEETEAFEDEEFDAFGVDPVEMMDVQVEMDVAEETHDEDAYRAAFKKLGKLTTGIPFNKISKARAKLGVRKVEPALAILDQRLSEMATKKLVVFAHHKEVIAKIAKHWGEGCVVVTGDTPQSARQEAVDRFQTAPEVEVFVASLLAAGTGITLTAASVVAFVESDWVPANMVQAEDRIHRIGQEAASVEVIHFAVEGSLDHRIISLLLQKEEIAFAALDADRDAAFLALAAKVEEKDKKRVALPTIPPEEKRAIHSALTALAVVCDGAVEEDGRGFNGFDSSFGRRLAALRSLSDGQAIAGRKMLRKYRRQLAGMGIVLGEGTST